MRERRKKIYKDDYDYNLSDEEGDRERSEAKAPPVLHEERIIPVVTAVPDESEETMIVEKILAMKTVEV